MRSDPRRRAATTAVTLTVAGALGIGVMAPTASAAAPKTIKVDNLKIWAKSVSGSEAKLQPTPTSK